MVVFDISFVVFHYLYLQFLNIINKYLKYRNLVLSFAIQSNKLISNYKQLIKDFFL